MTTHMNAALSYLKNKERLFIVYLFLKKGKNYYEGKQKTA